MSEKRPRPVRTALLLAGGALLVVVVVAYGARRALLRDALTAWLRSHGAEATARIDALGPSGLAGGVTVGDPRAPDLSIDDVAVGYGLNGLGFEVRSVTLTRPALHVRLHDGRLSFGALDPVIADLLKRPRPPQTPPIRIEAKAARVRLDTDYGPVTLVGDVSLVGDRLVSLTATTAPTRLRGSSWDLALGSGALRVSPAGSGLLLSLETGADTVVAGSLSAQKTHASVSARVPYPDLAQRAVSGPFAAQVVLSADRAAAGARALSGDRLVASLVGQVSGGVDTLSLTGHGDARLTSASGTFGTVQLGPAQAQVAATDLRWTRSGGDALSSATRLTGVVQDLRTGDFRAAQGTIAFQGPVRLSPAGNSARLAGSISGRGAWSGLGPPSTADTGQVVALKRAARDFRIAAPGVAVGWDGRGVQADLAQPVRLIPASGGSASLETSGHGGWRLAVGGGGLPTIEADIRNLRQGSTGDLSAQARLKTDVSIGPVEAGKADLSGSIRIAAGGASFTAARCAPLSADKLDFGANSIEALSLALCPEAGPLFQTTNAGWTMHGRLEKVAAIAPFLQARLADADAHVMAAQDRGRLAVSATIDGGRLEDTTKARRFEPLRLTGKATLAADRWLAHLALDSPKGQALAAVDLTDNTVTGVGRAEIQTGALSFAQGGLQPVDLSPMAAALAAPVLGQARFTGHFGWTPQGAESGGVLDIPRLDFNSPAGRVSGLTGRIVLTSLAPIIAPPGQTLRAQSIAAVEPLTDAVVSFEVQEKSVQVSGGEAAVGGGRIRVISLTVPLVDGATMRGVLAVEGVQLKTMVEASPFADRLALDARVSGRIPFESLAGKVSVSGGELHAIQPGRLSIKRTALAAAPTGGAVAGATAQTAVVPANDTFTDFAYQAMEHLAFDTLSASIDTRKDGRLGVLAHVVGKSDPPTHQEIRLSLLDLVRRKFLERPLPLPSGTGVDLTLDTTLNLDDLLAQYADYQRLRGSPPVQP